jgi:hypothetical protein
VSAHYRRIAGNLELFCGAYFVAFGVLAAIFFRDHHRPRVAMIAGAGALAGILLVTRASRLLGWRRWIFWTIALALMVTPVAWLLPRLS